MSKFIIMATTLAAFAMLPVAISQPAGVVAPPGDRPGPVKHVVNNMWYFVDVGSGGTRFLAQYENSTTHKLTPCCKGECQKESSARTNAHCSLSGKRFQDSSTVDGVAKCLEYQLEDLRASVNSQEYMRAGNNRKCYSGLRSQGTEITMLKLVRNVLNSHGIILGATAGARRVEIAGQSSFNHLMINGLKAGLQLLKEKYYANDTAVVVKPTAVRGGILPGPMEAYFGLLAGKEWYTKKTEGNVDNDFVFIEVGGASQQVGWFPDTGANVGLQQLAPTQNFKATHASLRATTRKTQTALKGDMDMSLLNNGNKVRSWGSSILGDGGERFMVKILKNAVMKNAGKSKSDGSHLALSACLREGTSIGCKDDKCEELAYKPFNGITKDYDGSLFKAATEALQVPEIKKWVFEHRRRITGIGDSSGNGCYEEAKAVFALPDETTGQIPHWTGMGCTTTNDAACKTMKSIIAHRDHAALMLEKPGYFTAPKNAKRLNVVVSSAALYNSAHSKEFFRNMNKDGVTYEAFVAEAQRNCKLPYGDAPYTYHPNQEDAYSFADCMAISELRCLIELVVKGDFTTPTEDPFMGRLFLEGESWVSTQANFEVQKKLIAGSPDVVSPDIVFTKDNTLINELKLITDKRVRS